jgi:hypothetical protein
MHTSGPDITLIYIAHDSTNLAELGLRNGVPRSHSDTSHSVGILWTSDQPVAETST